jgi:hypothetical protein
MSELPPDLNRIADLLREHRDQPDGHVLDRVQARLTKRPQRAGRSPLRRVRVTTLVVLAAALGANAAGAIAGVKTTTLVTQLVSNSSKTSSSNSAANSNNEVEKPGCGNEQDYGLSGGSGVHTGQPPKDDERGACPHSPGVDYDDFSGAPDPDSDGP